MNQKEIERIRAEQKLRSSILEAQATEILKRDAEEQKRKRLQEAQLYLDSGDEWETI